MRPPCRQEPLQLIQMLGDALARQENWQPGIYRRVNKDTEISPEQRNRTVRWLAQLNKKLRFYPETLALSTAILDRFLQSVKARPKYLSCIGIASFYLAAKSLEEDEVIPDTLELVRESECGCSVAEVLRMERVILDKLEWQIRLVTPLDFLHILHSLLLKKSPAVSSRMAAAQLSALTRLMTSCFGHHQLAAYRPTTLALAVLSLELEKSISNWLTATLWLQMLTKTETGCLIECREEISHCLAHTLKTRTVVDNATSNKATKRKVQEVNDDDDIYDGIKRLYNEEGPEQTPSTPVIPLTSCARELAKDPTSAKPALQAVAN